jgi:hypothetical protein
MTASAPPARTAYRTICGCRRRTVDERLRLFVVAGRPDLLSDGVVSRVWLARRDHFDEPIDDIDIYTVSNT